MTRRPAIEEARELDAVYRAGLRVKYGTLIERARSAMLTDTAYAVALAESAAANERRIEFRADPAQQEAHALRLHAQGAGLDEIRRATRMGKDRLIELLRDAPSKPQKAPQRVERAQADNHTRRPVTVRYVEPTKALDGEQVAPGQHGTLPMYTNRKCRCDLCRATATEYARQRRERKRSANSPK
ncbi:hypothetical protein KZC51_06030 [Microbacterium sp. SSW1-49]|uniref:Phage head morphogenesis domain-containing protein n=1 Tax=Microbacterium croceum TaxID=2851645 RepID=A0ABT0FCA1_9MICO|nr:hypothetical protein [Microbacterium croceum]MCK2035690.1 hypothetical protein [Microbacterium croceum]